MRLKVRDRLGALLHANHDPGAEEMVGRAREAIKTSQTYSEKVAGEQENVMRLLASVRREVAVIRLGAGDKPR